MNGVDPGEPASGPGADLSEPQLQRIFGLLRTTSGVDFSRYKRSTILRRIRRRMALGRHDRADAYLKGGYGGLVGFELKGGRAAGERFINALKMIYHVANIGDARTLAIHPATTTHSQLTGEEQLRTGVTEGYVRLSVGIEHIDDILADLDQALKVAGS